MQGVDLEITMKNTNIQSNTQFGDPRDWEVFGIDLIMNFENLNEPVRYQKDFQVTNGDRETDRQTERWRDY